MGDITKRNKQENEKLMVYIGFRVETISRIISGSIDKISEDYNARYDFKIINPISHAKIIAKKAEPVVLARGEKEKKDRPDAATNFSLVVPIKKESEAERVAKIINVLGNGKLVRERINLFCDRKSTLNNIPELCLLVDAFKALDTYIPGIIRGGWYYAPEIVYKKEDK